VGHGTECKARNLTDLNKTGALFETKY